ncbi:hypothetical protein V2G26_012293 [Clonostachys chloroleuca]|uniref:Hydrophobin n=1 Tax=Clonostachys chloroleuca TaxID=1926264 RepID=A0AA35Q3L9_9HYPO|nr:unnamed protein product [Clonostachys chloroleuca]
MRSFFVIATLAVGAFGQSYDPCPNDLKNHALCCNAGLENVINFDCHTPAPYPTLSGEEFQATCAKTGSYPKCCTLKIISQGLLCEDPAGIENPETDTFNPEGDNELQNLLGDVGNILNEVLSILN